MINEAISQANSKLKDFIAHLSDEDQKTIKDILNGIYLFFKRQNFTYEEISKPNKSPYHGTFTKMGGSKDIDQLTWKLKVTVPLSYDKSPIAKLGNEIRSEVKSLASKLNASYFYDSTNKDFYEAVGFNKDKVVEIGRHTDGSGIFYDHNNDIVKIIFVIKVAVPRFVEDKTKKDTSDNHKAIISKVKSFVETNAFPRVNKALDEIYAFVNKEYNGCIESKRVMEKEAEIDLRSNRYDDSKREDYRALIWKTELKDTSSRKYLDEEKLAKSYSIDNPLRISIDGSTYTVGKVDDGYYVGIRYDYGSRDTRYLYFVVLKKDYNAEQIIISNKFLSSDGRNLKNTHVSVSYDKGRKSISGADLEDMANMPRFYTTKTRGIDTAWEKLIEVFDENTTDSDCMRIIGYDKTHMYYAMD